MLEVTKATLEIYNYQVLTASNGIEAVAAYANNQDAIARSSDSPKAILLANSFIQAGDR